MSTPPDATPTPVETPSRVQALGALLGQETLQTSTWMRDGVIVRVRVSYWRPRAQLELDDLGLPQLAEHERASLRTLLRLGNKRLLPDTHYRELERRARAIYRVLETTSYTTRWGQFVPLRAYEGWAVAHAAAVADFLAVRDTLVTNRDAISADLRTQYTVVAQRAWRILAAHENASMFEDVFVSTFCDRIVACIPSADRIFDSFAVDVAYNLILPPEQSADSRETARVFGGGGSPFAPVLRAVQEQRMELVGSFLTDVTLQLRTLVAKAAGDILDAIREPGKWRRAGLHPRSLARLRALVEQVEQLNFVGDGELTAMMEQIRLYLEQPARERTVEAVTTLLETIRKRMQTTLRDLEADSTRAARQESATGMLETLPPDDQRGKRVRDSGEVPLLWDDQRVEREA